MQFGKTSDVNFGCRLTQRFEVDTRWNHGEKSRVGLLNGLKKIGNSGVIIDTKSGGFRFANSDYDIIKIPKYHYKKRLYEGARNLENVENAINSAIRNILEKAFRKGKLSTVAESLSKDFPNMKTLISELSQNLTNKKVSTKEVRLFFSNLTRIIF